MTANDAATLLRTYADALETEHPMPADQTDLARLIGTLDDESVDALDLPLHDSSSPRRVGVRTAVALGLAAAIALLVGYALLNDDSDVRTADIPGGGGSGFVFEGETVIREDPLVVIANQPIEPTFDTSELGERIVYESPFDVDMAVLDEAADKLIDGLQAMAPPGTDVEIQKIAIHALHGARPIAVTVSDFPNSFARPAEPDGTTRFLAHCEGNGCSLDSTTLDPDADLTAMRPPSTYGDHLALMQGQEGFGLRGASAGAGEFSVMFLLSLDIAAVQLVTAEQQLWTVPIDGVAVLSVSGDEMTPFEIVTYDLDGGEVTRQRMTVDGGFR